MLLQIFLLYYIKILPSSLKDRSLNEKKNCQTFEVMISGTKFVTKLIYFVVLIIQLFNYWIKASHGWSIINCAPNSYLTKVQSPLDLLDQNTVCHWMKLGRDTLFNFEWFDLEAWTFKIMNLEYNFRNIYTHMYIYIYVNFNPLVI